jgi:4-amino-4-deoxy-L-arabinose transferase-like glycosyltransferase
VGSHEATWQYRLPSLIGAILAVLGTLVIGRWLFDSQTGCSAAALLAASPLLAVEAMVATRMQVFWPPSWPRSVAWLAFTSRTVPGRGRFWPGSLIAVPGVVAAVRRRTEFGETFCLAWLLPAWLLFEIVPTKLPHYVLPTFPALALLIARAVLIGVPEIHSRMTRVSVGLWAELESCSRPCCSARPSVSKPCRVRSGVFLRSSLC